MIMPRPPLNYESTYLTRDTLALFNFKRVRTEAWNASFIISGTRLGNRLSTLCFEPERVAELKSMVFNIVWRTQINAWWSRAIRDDYVLVSDTDLLPHPSLSLYEAAFTNSGNNGYINTPRFSLYLPFTDQYSGTPYLLSATLYTDFDVLVTASHHHTLILTTSISRAPLPFHQHTLTCHITTITKPLSSHSSHHH